MDHFVNFSASILLFLSWPKVECAYFSVYFRSFHGESLCGGQSEAIILFAKLRLDLSNPFIVLIDRVNSAR